MKGAKLAGFGWALALASLILFSTGPVTQAGPPSGGTPQLLDEIAGQLGVIQGQLDVLAGGSDRVSGARSSEGLIVSPTESSHVLVDLPGPGVFISARMTKQGGASGLTAVSLEMDGQIVVQRNIVALKNLGMTQHNPFGVAVFTSAVGIDAVTIGFSEPIAYESNLKLRAIVGEPGVVQIIGTVIHGN